MYTIGIFYQEKLFISQCFDRFQSSGSECRENTERQTDEDGKSDSHQNRLECNDSLDDIPQSKYDEITKENAYNSTDNTQD